VIDKNFGYLGAALIMVGSVAYAWDTLRGNAKPNRVTWTMWTAAPLVAFAGMMHDGAEFATSSMTLCAGLGPALVLACSFVNKNSVWKLTAFDLACGGLSVIGLIALVSTGSGLAGVTFGVLADCLALPTLVKSWVLPDSESDNFFWLSAIGATITLLAGTQWGFVDVAFPVYGATASALLAVLIRFRLGPRLWRPLLRSAPVTAELRPDGPLVPGYGG